MSKPSYQEVLQAAAGVNLRNVVVIGELAEGHPFVAMSGNVGIGDALLLMERAKQYLVSVQDIIHPARKEE